MVIVLGLFISFCSSFILADFTKSKYGFVSLCSSLKDKSLIVLGCTSSWLVVLMSLHSKPSPNVYVFGDMARLGLVVFQGF